MYPEIHLIFIHLDRNTNYMNRKFFIEILSIFQLFGSRIFLQFSRNDTYIIRKYILISYMMMKTNILYMNINFIVYATLSTLFLREFSLSNNIRTFMIVSYIRAARCHHYATVAQRYLNTPVT